MIEEPDENSPEYRAFAWAFIYASNWLDALDGWKQMEIREAWFKYKEEITCLPESE